MTGFTTIDIVIVVIYMMVLIGVGIWTARKTKTTEDFMVAGRSIGIWRFTAAMAACVIGGSLTMGSSTLAYNFGVGAIWLGGICALSIFYLEASTDSGFAIRSCQRQLVALQAEQNIIQDRKTVLAANHTADCLQLVEQPCTRYLKFHTCIIYLICFHFLHLLFPLTVHFLIF